MAEGGDGRDGLKVDPALVRRIAEILDGLRFGSVEVIVHDSQVVQIERREKVRLDAPSARSNSPRR